MPIGMPGCPEFACCTASIASARIALASSARAFIRSLPSGRGTKSAPIITGAAAQAPQRDRPLSGSGLRDRSRRLLAVLALAHELDAKLLQLAVEMSTLEADALRDAGNIAALASDVVLEINSFKGIPRVAQRLVERQVMRDRRHCSWVGQGARDFLLRDLIARASERQRAHDALQLRQVAGPFEIAQCVQRGGCQLARRRLARLHHTRQREVGDV